MRATLNSFFRSETGTTAIEYGLIGAMVSVFALTALSAMGDGIVTVFDISSGAIQDSLPE